MLPFDEGYLARREKQIQDMFMLRSIFWGCVLSGLALTVPSLLLMAHESILGPILLVVALSFLVSSFFIFGIYRAQVAADRAIQKERERLFALYNQSMEKPKRDNAVRLSDDGELTTEDQPKESSQRSTR